MQYLAILGLGIVLGIVGIRLRRRHGRPIDRQFVLDLIFAAAGLSAAVAGGAS